jgi:C-terminal processing protease CtpA/Prc
LEPGDEIVKVDGKDVTEDTFPGIVIGSDQIGSIVTLTVLKKSGEV